MVAIAEIDTRRLTRILRDHGPLNGCIIAGGELDTELEKNGAHRELALAAAKDFPGLVGMDLAKVVSCQESYSWEEGSWDLNEGHRKPDQEGRFHVVAYDFGVKRNILRMLTDRSCKVTVVPAQTPASEVLAMSPDGVFLSNGPGDPEPCDYAIKCYQGDPGNGYSDIRDLSGTPATGIGQWRENCKNETGPSWRKPSGSVS